MKDRKEVRYDRGALDEFCSTVREVEKDKDKVLDASHLQRQEKQPAFSSAQMLAALLLIAFTVVGAVGAICMTIAGETGCAFGIVGATLFVMAVIGLAICAE